MLYGKIIHPYSKKKININSKRGIKLIKNYIKQIYGGSALLFSKKNVTPPTTSSPIPKKPPTIARATSRELESYFNGNSFNDAIDKISKKANFIKTSQDIYEQMGVTNPNYLYVFLLLIEMYYSFKYAIYNYDFGMINEKEFDFPAFNLKIKKLFKKLIKIRIIFSEDEHLKTHMDKLELLDYSCNQTLKNLVRKKVDKKRNTNKPDTRPVRRSKQELIRRITDLEEGLSQADKEKRIQSATKYKLRQRNRMKRQFLKRPQLVLNFKSKAEQYELKDTMKILCQPKSALIKGKLVRDIGGVNDSYINALFDITHGIFFATTDDDIPLGYICYYHKTQTELHLPLICSIRDIGNTLWTNFIYEIKDNHLFRNIKKITLSAVKGADKSYSNWGFKKDEVQDDPDLIKMTYDFKSWKTMITGQSGYQAYFHELINMLKERLKGQISEIIFDDLFEKFTNFFQHFSELIENPEQERLHINNLKTQALELNMYIDKYISPFPSLIHNSMSEDLIITE